MMVKKSVLITGATGFVGSHLAKRLIEENLDVHIITRTGSDFSQLQSIQNLLVTHEYDGSFPSILSAVRNSKPTVVFHLASCVLTDHQGEDVRTLIESNILFGAQLLDAMRLEGVKHFINTGTNWQHYEDKEFAPVNLYAATKQAFKDVLRFYIDADEFRAVTLSLFDTYGNDDPRPKLLNLLRAYSQKADAIDMTPGEQFIDIVHVDDVVEAYLHASELLLTGQIDSGANYAVGSGRPLRLKEFVSIFEKSTNAKVNVNWGARPYRKREMMSPWSGDNLPGWQPKITIEKGLKEWSMGQKKSMTIGIPTYNRKLLVAELLHELKAANLPETVKILVIDNASTDGTFEHLSTLFSGDEQIDIKQNVENIGYGGNFFRLFDECKTDYLLINSDEDSIVSENIEDYLTFIEQNNPLFICPQAEVCGALYRGRSKSSKLNALDYREASFYTSGVTFHVAKARLNIARVRDLLNVNMAATLYPQMLLAALMIIKGDCYWWDKLMTAQRRSSKTYISDESGSPYYFLSARWSQYKGYIEFFENLVQNLEWNEKQMAMQMLQKEQSELYGRLRDGLAHERPELLSFFDEGAKKASLK